MTRTNRLSRLALFGICAVLLAGCGSDASGEPEPTSEPRCPEGACSGNGSCEMVGGEPVCDCDPGFGGPDCQPDCASVDCGAHGACEPTDQGPACICDRGYQGTACDSCDDGYQDHDEDGSCRPDCSIAGLHCTHAICEDASGEAECVCVEGHEGNDCADCVAGYQDHDGDGQCLPTCETAYPYCGHGKCDDSGGAPVCACNPSWGGDHCDECATGYQDHDEDGACEPDCDTAVLACDRGACDDATGVARCVCEAGYGGSACDTCALGYQDYDGNGTCLPKCNHVALSCGHGSCVDDTGVPACDCDPGYKGSACDQCAADFQDHDSDGECRPACSTPGYDCSGVGTCSDASGEAVCSCPADLYDDGKGHCVDAAGFWCNGAVELDLFGGAVTGTTEGAGDEHDAECQPHTGEDFIYTFSLSEARRLRFHLTGFDSVLYIRSACDDDETEVACSDDGGPAATARLEQNFDPGQYFLFVDGYGSEGGEFALDVDVLCGPGQLYDASQDLCIDDPCEPNSCVAPHASQCHVDPAGAYECTCDPGFVVGASPGTCEPDPAIEGLGCEDALPLDVGSGTLSGSTAGASSQMEGTCGGDGPERVYTFSITERMRATFEMPGYDTVLYVRRKCDKYGTQLGCSDDVDTMAAELSTVLEPGTYFLFADSAESSGGSYTLSYEFRTDPCTPDPCPGLPACVTSQDWTAYECVCPAGSLPYGTDCMDDPCEPNPCAGNTEHRTRCSPDLPNAHACECSVGYLEDTGGACVPDPAAADWSFLVFMNADNNLEDDGYDDLAEMGVAGSTASVHVAALFDTYSQDGGDGRKVTVTQGGYVVEENLGEVDMGDWNTLAEYGMWAVNAYPARHYALVLWNHGDGWRHRPAEPPLSFKVFSTDDHGSGDGISISNGDYARAMGAITDELGDKLDLVGFDACLMGMWEVAEASAPFARALVASEETEPLSGWPYDDFLVPLTQDPDTDALELGTWIVDAYHDDKSANSTLSVVDLETMGALRTAMSNFADAMRSNPGLYASLESRRKSTQSFSWYDAYRDLKDFAGRVESMSGAPAEVTDAAAALVAQLDVTILHSLAQSSHGAATGMSIYFPGKGDGMSSAYRGEGAVWSVNTSWDEFLESFAQ